MQRHSTANVLLSAALILVFASFGVDKLLTPNAWITWIPSWMEGWLGLTRIGWLTLLGIIEIGLAIIIAIPVRPIRRAGVILMIVYFIPVLTQVGWNHISIRDTALLLSALALLSLL